MPAFKALTPAKSTKTLKQNTLDKKSPNMMQALVKSLSKQTKLQNKKYQLHTKDGAGSKIFKSVPKRSGMPKTASAELLKTEVNDDALPALDSHW